jgi:cobalt ECF transporter T component CbiQ
MSGKVFINYASARTDLIIHEYQERSSYQGFHRWDPKLKLILLATVIGLNVVIAKFWLSLTLFLISIGIAVWSSIPPRLFALFFLAPAWATLMVFLGFSVGFGTTPIASIGPLTVYREGMFQGLSAAARVASDMSWMASVFLTTPFTKVLDALQWFRVPAILVETIAMAYRYAFLLIDEFIRMRDACRTRGGFQGYRKRIISTAMILAQIILRAYDRARSIQIAMMARGANTGEKNRMSSLIESNACPNSCDVTPDYMDKSVPILSCSNLSYSFSQNRALKETSLTVQKGEVVALCGPNGAGKTTLLRLFSGILTPSEGEIFLCGQRLDKKTRKEAFRYVGILFQDPAEQLFCTHVREDIAFGPTNRGLTDDDVERLVETAMDLMEVKHLANRPIHMLSHGEMRRVGLAGLIAMRPPLVLLDEPTANLDPASAKQFVRLLKHLNEHHGYTFLVVTHNINLASLIAKRIIILNEGRIIADGTLKKILTDEKLLERSRLEPPLLTRLFQRIMEDTLSENDIPVTIDEAVDILNSQILNDSFPQGEHLTQ